MDIIKKDNMKQESSDFLTVFLTIFILLIVIIFNYLEEKVKR